MKLNDLLYPSRQFQSSKSVALNVYEGFALVAMKFVVFIQSLPEWDRNLGLRRKVKRKHCVMFFSTFGHAHNNLDHL